MTIYSPSNSENVTFFYTTSAITISSVRGVVTGTAGATGPTVTFSMISGADRSTTTTTNVNGQVVSSTTTGNSVTVANSSISANTYVWIITSATTGTVNSINWTLSF